MHPLFKYIYFPLAMGIFVMLKSCSNSDNINQKPNINNELLKPSQQSVIDKKTTSTLSETDNSKEFPYSSSFSKSVGDIVNLDMSKLKSRTSPIENKISGETSRISYPIIISIIPLVFAICQLILTMIFLIIRTTTIPME